jgi:hypothetical protein
MYQLHDISLDLPNQIVECESSEQLREELDYRLSPVHSGKCGRTYMVRDPDGNDIDAWDWLYAHTEG